MNDSMNVTNSNSLIINNLSLLLKNLLLKTSMSDKTLDIIDQIFEEIDDLTKKDEEESGEFSWVALRKAHLFSQVIA